MINHSALYGKGRQPTARRMDPARQGILPSPQPFFVFNDRYAPTNRLNEPHHLAKTFSFGLRHQFGRKKA